MSRVSVNFEVSEEVYEEVVHPKKMDKRFSRLLVALLEGYLEDDYIRAFVDGDLEGRDSSVGDALKNALNEAKEAHAESGFFTQKARGTAQEGLDTFGGRESDGEEDSRIDDLTNQVSNLTQMVEKLVAGGVELEKPHKPEGAPKPIPSTPEPGLSQTPVSVVDSIDDEDIEYDDEEEDYSGDDYDDVDDGPPDAKNFLNKLATGTIKSGL